MQTDKDLAFKTMVMANTMVTSIICFSKCLNICINSTGENITSLHHQADWSDHHRLLLG